MKTFLIKDQTVLVDDDIYEQIKDKTWYITTSGYVQRTDRIGTTSKSHTFLHHVVSPKTQGLVIDHINRNKLDNQRLNLRYVPHWVNLHNRPAQSNSLLGDKGISWSKVQKQWHAYIWVNKKRIHLGYHNDYNEALKVRKEAELKYIPIAI